MYITPILDKVRGIHGVYSVVMARVYTYNTMLPPPHAAPYHNQNRLTSI